MISKDLVVVLEDLGATSPNTGSWPLRDGLHHLFTEILVLVYLAPQNLIRCFKEARLLTVLPPNLVFTTD